MQRFLSFSVLFILISVTSVFQSPEPVWAQKTKITKGNKSEFSKLVGKGKYVCRTLADGTTTFGTLKGKKLKPGAVVTDFNRDSFRSKTLKKIDRWNSRIERLESRASVSKRKLKRLEKKVRKAEANLLDADVKYQECTGRDPSEDGGSDEDGSSGGGSGEFSGDPHSLAAYRDDITDAEIAHLLDSVAFGGSDALWEIGRNQGLRALVDALVDGVTTPQEDQDFDAVVEQWTSKAYYYPEYDPDYGRIYTTQAVQIGQWYRFIFSENPFSEWMLLNMSAHVAVNLDAIDFSYAQFTHYGLKQHWDLLREHSTGNFRSLIHGLLTDPAMNAYLDNVTNQKGSLNQNFARELLELFTLGTADPVTKQPNYDQSTVDAITIAVTGYDYTFQTDPVTGQSVVDVGFVPSRHDDSPVAAFTGFAGAEINQSMLPGQLVDHVLDNHPNSARYIAERFAGLALYPGLPEGLVAQLASILRAHQFEIAPFMKEVLVSSAMFSQDSRDACLSSPIEYLVKLARKTLKHPLVSSGEEGQRNYWMLYSLLDGAGSAGQRLFEPPSVFAWDGACNINRSGKTSYGEEWMTAQRLLNRTRACGDFMNSLSWTGYDFVAGFGLSDGMTAEQIIERVSANVYDATLAPDQVNLLMSFLREVSDWNGGTQQMDPNLSEEWWVKLKLPRLACLIGTSVEVNLK